MARAANKITKRIRTAMMIRLYYVNAIGPPVSGGAVCVVVVSDCDGLMVRITLATRVSPPPDPVMVSVNDPVGALPDVLKVRVEE
jgi:hypothetical protein